MKTKLLGILSVSGGMLISSHAFGEDIMGYSKEKLQESVQETAYKFWEHCPKGDHDKGKISGLEFVKPEKATPEVEPKPKKKPDPGAANKWKGKSWNQLEDEERREFAKYIKENNLPIPDEVSQMDRIKYKLFKLNKKPKGNPPPPPKKEPTNPKNMTAQEALQQAPQLQSHEWENTTLEDIQGRFEDLKSALEKLDAEKYKDAIDALEQLGDLTEEIDDDKGVGDYEATKEKLDPLVKTLTEQQSKLEEIKEQKENLDEIFGVPGTQGDLAYMQKQVNDGIEDSTSSW
ncbi:MAG: hypothetical protein LW808_002325 [Verrucomicrobiota bacterium]|nr:MAG: hypothetical protein LW808_002325 [Verrucomicrobiota bacterium]